MLYLVEHFYSIQGEGKFVGKPSLFLRFGGCNMKCEGFGCEEVLQDSTTLLGCDTIYAVNKKHFSKIWQEINSADELLKIVKSYNLPTNVDIVLTGGEPLLYANDKILIRFLELICKDFKITFETNASLHVDFEKHQIFKECCFALSVKLSNSGEEFKKRVNEKNITNITKNAKDAFFKFSIGAGNLSKSLEDEMAQIISLSPKTEVYCMPMGAKKEEIEKNSPPLVEFCKTKGYNFSDRLHIRIWDTKKGI